jgi:hypothetical protein
MKRRSTDFYSARSMHRPKVPVAFNNRLLGGFSGLDAAMV